jgi:site-specific DNA-methyltransferase (adenine-specific)
MTPAPYFQDEHFTLYQGDFRTVLPQLDPLDVDLVVTDPPYGETSLAWDRWPAGWPTHIPGRSMWCFGSFRMFTERWAEFAAAGWKMSQDVVFEKSATSSFTTDRFRRVHEMVVHFYREDWATIYHDTPRVPRTAPDKGTVRRAASGKGVHGGRGAVTYVDDGTRLAPSVIRVPTTGRPDRINPTEKPAALLDMLIRYGCPPAGLVLDVFAGSCSTLLAARNAGRRAVGVELRPEQCASAVAERLSQGVLDFGGDMSG